MADYLEDLYTPVATPGTTTPVSTGRFSPTTQAMTQSLSGTNPNANLPTMPIGAGNTMYKGAMFGQEDIGNVGGVVGMDNQTKKQEAIIPEVDEDYFKTAGEIKKEDNKEAGGAALSGAAKGAKVGASIGSVIPGFGTVIGGAVGALAGGAIGFFGTKNKQKK